MLSVTDACQVFYTYAKELSPSEAEHVFRFLDKAGFLGNDDVTPEEFSEEGCALYNKLKEGYLK